MSRSKCFFETSLAILEGGLGGVLGREVLFEILLYHIEVPGMRLGFEKRCVLCQCDKLRTAKLKAELHM